MYFCSSSSAYVTQNVHYGVTSVYYFGSSRVDVVFGFGNLRNKSKINEIEIRKKRWDEAKINEQNVFFSFAQYLLARINWKEHLKSN